MENAEKPIQFPPEAAMSDEFRQQLQQDSKHGVLIKHPTVESINMDIQTPGIDANQVSDGYHTFGELYAHRIALWIALCKHIADVDCLYGSKNSVWRSKAHSDGSVWDGWFILGVNYNAGEQVTYHLPMSEWDSCDLAKTLDKAPEWDGHTSADVLARIKNL